jgi:hypothetical protein
MAEQPKEIIMYPIIDVVKNEMLYDLCGDAGESQVYNLKLENNGDFLLENGGYILLE